MNPWFALLGGGVLLYFGAEWFVGGASRLATSLRVPQLLIGLTVVAYGTSAPEVIVGIQAALGGHGDVALGNVVGSNIANAGLILGIAALVKPARVDGALARRELPVLALSALAVPLLLVDGRVGVADSVALLFAAAAYTVWMVRGARASMLASSAESAEVTAGAADTAGGPESHSSLRSGVTALAGLGILLLGGDIFIGAAVRVATAMGLSDRIVGLTIVAVGTSLPELVTSVIAAMRGHSDIAVGNVIGSNIFNVLLCLGAAGLAGPVGAELRTVAPDLATLVLMTGLLVAFTRSARTISRVEGGILLAAFVLFTTFTVANG